MTLPPTQDGRRARARAVALVDGEHYPPVVRDALQIASRADEVVAAVLLGGTEKLDRTPDYGVPLVAAGEHVAATVLEVASRHAATRLLDLSDEPVLGEDARFRLASHALAAGLSYRGPDFELWPPEQVAVDVPTLAVIGTGKRLGKTAVAGYVARLLAGGPIAGRDGEVVVLAMGRGGPATPEVIEASSEIGLAELVERARAGEHAASDFLEDAVLARTTTVGCRRCGGGLAGAPFTSNAAEGARIAAARGPALLVLEGSGAALPPVRGDRTLLVTSAARPAAGLLRGLGPYRVLRSQLVVVTMAEPPAAGPEQLDELRAALAELAPDLPVVATVLRPVPSEPLEGERVAYFTTAPAAMHERLANTLAERHGARVVAVSGALSDRAALRRDLEREDVGSAETYLVEIKAAAIDTVARAAEERGARVVFCDNRPEALEGEPDLEELVRTLAEEAVAARSPAASRRPAPARGR